MKSSWECLFLVGGVLLIADVPGSLLYREGKWQEQTEIIRRIYSTNITGRPMFCSLVLQYSKHCCDGFWPVCYWWREEMTCPQQYWQINSRGVYCALNIAAEWIGRAKNRAKGIVRTYIYRKQENRCMNVYNICLEWKKAKSRERQDAFNNAYADIWMLVRMRKRNHEYRGPCAFCLFTLNVLCLLRSALVFIDWRMFGKYESGA